MLGVELTSPSEGATVSVTVMANAILEESTFEATLDEEGGVYHIFPRIRYKYDTLTRNKQSIPLEVTFSVTVDDEELEDQTVTVTLRSINDCPYPFSAPTATPRTSPLCSPPMSTSSTPLSTRFSARRSTRASSIPSPLQSGDPAEVYRQVYALWQWRSPSAMCYSRYHHRGPCGDHAVSTSTRELINESINNGQANCVDGSVLLASLLRKIDIEPSLVYIPGHCYLAFYLDADKTQLVGLETTLIGGAGR